MDAGLLKAKLARYRAELLEPEKKGAKGEVRSPGRRVTSELMQRRRVAGIRCVKGPSLAHLGSSISPDKGGIGQAGYGRVALIGFPSVGKSTLLSKLTGTESSVAAYEYVRRSHA